MISSHDFAVKNVFIQNFNRILFPC